MLHPLQALVPVTIEVEVPFDLHRYIIGQKGSGIRKMMDEFEVSCCPSFHLLCPGESVDDCVGGLDSYNILGSAVESKAPL